VVLPETIPVRYTEEEAEYLSVRPVVRQTFRLEELMDMVLAVTGKDPVRIQQILRAGTIVFNFYRYWWVGFEASAEELREVLARFPDSDPGRRFNAEECTSVVIEGPGSPPRVMLEIERKAAERKRLFQSSSFWDCLLGLAGEQTPAYKGYSYARRADAFQVSLSEEQVARCLREAARLAPRGLAMQIRQMPEVRGILFLCPRLRPRKENAPAQQT
jgi:hypothetical protein